MIKITETGQNVVENLSMSMCEGSFIGIAPCRHGRQKLQIVEVSVSLINWDRKELASAVKGICV